MFENIIPEIVKLFLNNKHFKYFNNCFIHC